MVVTDMQLRPGSAAKARQSAWPRAIALFTAILFTQILLMWPTLGAMARTWVNSSVYHHGAIAAPLSLWLILRRRGEIAHAPQPSWAGMALALAFIAAWLTGRAASTEIVAQLAFVGIIIASVGIGASVMAPQFGGQVTIAGRRVVEVLPRADGLVLAEVRDAGGTPMDSGRVLVDVSGIDGRRHPVELRYDTDLLVFEGSADVALAPVPAPVQVTVRAEGEAPTTATMLGVPVAAVPSHGGQVIVVGPLAPEVRVDTNGEVHAYLPSAPSQPPPGTLYAVVNVGQPEPRRVELEYVPEEGHYVAQLGSGVRPVGGDLSLDLEVDGQVHRGRVRQVTLAPPTRLGGSVVVAGDYGLEVANVDGELQATIADSSGAYVSAPPPQIDVYVTVDGAGWMISTSEVTERAAEVNECAPES